MSASDFEALDAVLRQYAGAGDHGDVEPMRVLTKQPVKSNSFYIEEYLLGVSAELRPILGQYAGAADISGSSDAADQSLDLELK